MELETTAPLKQYHFLQGGGEMGQLIRNFNWKSSLIGDPEKWPQSLRTSLNIILNSKFPMFIWWGPELVMIYNDAYMVIAGDKHPKALGGRGKEVWSEIWDVVGPLSEKVMIDGQSTWADDQLLHINRRGYIEESYFTFSYSPILTESGSVGGVFCACTETTEKVLATKRLEKSESKLRNIILQAPVAMCIFRGPEHIVEIANEQMFELFGRRGEEVMFKPIFEGLPEAKEQGLEQLLFKVLTTGERFIANERPVTLPRNGKIETTYISFVYEPIKEADSSISGIMVVAIDVTLQVFARQKIEEVVTERTKELAAANLQLQQNNNELKQFAYIASHDLQEPVRKVSTFAQMLKNSLGPVNDKSNNYIDKISTSANRMLALIRDVLTYSQLSKESETFEPVNLATVLENIKSDFELLIEQKQAIINSNGLPTIEAIPLQMNQLFSNLISNGLKFTRDGIPPVININVTPVLKADIKQRPELNPQLEYYDICFSDNGIGFDQQHANQIFNIFQRLHGKSQYSGTGIGLAICKKIAINHQGDIYASSEANRGATFNILLPKSHHLN